MKIILVLCFVFFQVSIQSQFPFEKEPYIPNQFLVNVSKPIGKWDHFWEECVGSGHAALALRADYQYQLTQTHTELGFKQVRFHGLFVDDMSVVLPSEQNSGILFSFFNIDRVFDFLLSIGMKPLVEIGFMPELLASGNKTWSHYKANVTPPKHWDQWTNLITSFVEHLIDRYGLEEILTWNFEVWNEPNCCPHDFWTGSQADYFYLFNVTSLAAKSVNPNIRIGGPATAMSSWIPEFLSFCERNNVPYDFISTHEYPTDPPGPQTRTFFVDHLKLTREIVGELPLYYTEYDDGYNDATSYSAAFVIFQNYLANGVVDTLSWWPFTDIFEEGGLYPDPFDNGYGIPKPNYRAFQLLHWTGDTLVWTSPDTFYNNNQTLGVFGVTGNNTSIFVVNWNVMNHPISEEKVEITVFGVNASTTAIAYRIDSKNTNAYPLWVEMGKPAYLSPKQVHLLKQASLLVPEPLPLKVISPNSVYFVVTVPPNAVVNVVLI